MSFRSHAMLALLVASVAAALSESSNLGLANSAAASAPPSPPPLPTPVHSCLPSVRLPTVRRRQQFTVATVGLALFNDIMLLLMLVPMLPSLLGDGLPVSDIRLACVFSAKDVFQVLFAPLAGALTLRLGARHALGASLLALAAATVAFAEAKGFHQLLGARALQGVTSAALMTAGFTHIAETHV